MQNNINVSEQVSFIFNIANKLRGPYTQDKYKDVIIPMTIIRRFECVLSNTKERVLEKAKTTSNEYILKDVSGYDFYNTSKLTLEKLLDDPNNIASNLISYVNSFSKEVREIIERLEFEKDIKKMDENNKLYGIVKAFSTVDLSPENVESIKMGYIFEELIRKFSENAEAGDHYTPREVIQLMVDLLLAEGSDDLYQEGKIVTVGDFACGTGGMLSIAYDRIKEYNQDTDVELFGQEINDESLAMCTADMLIKGQDPKRIRKQDTLEDDAFPEHTMRYVIMNPPFGISYAKNVSETRYEKIVKDNRKGGRFEGGLPATNDSQLLFMQHAIYKLDKNIGRAAIISNGSPLFSGGATSGESSIRKWLFDNDYVEALVGLPNDLFYNTGIGIYVFIINMNKPEERKNKVQLINATSDKYCKRLSKGLGFKRNEIKPEHMKEIVKMYSDFMESEDCKIFDIEDFYYREVTIEQPLQLNFMITEDRINNLWNESAFNKLFDEDKYNELQDKLKPTKAELNKITDYEEGKKLHTLIIERLSTLVSDKKWINRDEFSDHILNVFKDVKEVKGSLLKAIIMGLSERDKTSDIYKNKKGEIEADSSLRDTEIIPFKKDIYEYFKEEVEPYVPDAWMIDDEDKIKVACEINFNKYFYKYEEPTSTEDLLDKLIELEKIESSLIEVLKNG